jgi:4-aminobutyrate aminotransferase
MGLLCFELCLKGGTYAGNAVSCAAASATLDVLQSENILDNVNTQGHSLRKSLSTLHKRFPAVISDVRGLGLMNAVEFQRNPKTVGIASELSNECFKKELLLLTTSAFETIRFVPSLTVKADEVKKCCDIFSQAVETVAKKRGL